MTRYYPDLRGGVTRAALAPILMAVLLAGEIVRSSLALALVNSVGLSLASTLVRQWMDRRFGRVVSNHQWLVMMVCVAAFFVTLRLDKHGIGTGRPSLLFLAAAVYGLWLVVRLWPLALHNLLPVIVAAHAAFTFCAVENRAELLIWERQSYILTLLAWTAAGVIDCALLMRVLPHREAQSVESDGETDADAI